MNAPEPVIALHKLSKKYPRTGSYALRNVTFQVNRGEVYGFLGPNGAGKTTLIRTLMNFLQPSTGTAVIDGLDSVRDSVAIKARTGYLSGEVSLYSRMTGRQFLEYMTSLQPPKHDNYVRTLTAQLKAELTKPIGSLSKGNRQKIGIIQACMHEPDVLIMDEPTSGLDPLMQEVFFDIIAQAKARGATVFLSSHDLNEVQKMCDRIGFIREGRLVSEQLISQLRKTASQTFDITFLKDPPLDELKKLRNGKVLSAAGKTVTLYTKGDLTHLFTLLAKHPVLSLDKRQLDLEQEFIHFYGPKVKGAS